MSPEHSHKYQRSPVCESLRERVCPLPPPASCLPPLAYCGGALALLCLPLACVLLRPLLRAHPAGPAIACLLLPLLAGRLAAAPQVMVVLGVFCLAAAVVLSPPPILGDAGRRLLLILSEGVWRASRKAPWLLLVELARATVCAVVANAAAAGWLPSLASSAVGEVLVPGTAAASLLLGVASPAVCRWSVAAGRFALSRIPRVCWGVVLAGASALCAAVWLWGPAPAAFTRLGWLESATDVVVWVVGEPLLLEWQARLAVARARVSLRALLRLGAAAAAVSVLASDAVCRVLRWLVVSATRAAGAGVVVRFIWRFLELGERHADLGGALADAVGEIVHDVSRVYTMCYNSVVGQALLGVLSGVGSRPWVGVPVLLWWLGGGHVAGVLVHLAVAAAGAPPWVVEMLGGDGKGLVAKARDLSPPPGFVGGAAAAVRALGSDYLEVTEGDPAVVQVDPKGRLRVQLPRPPAPTPPASSPPAKRPAAAAAGCADKAAPAAGTATHAPRGGRCGGSLASSWRDLWPLVAPVATSCEVAGSVKGELVRLLASMRAAGPRAASLVIGTILEVGASAERRLQIASSGRWWDVRKAGPSVIARRARPGKQRDPASVLRTLAEGRAGEAVDIASSAAVAELPEPEGTALDDALRDLFPEAGAPLSAGDAADLLSATGRSKVREALVGDSEALWQAEVLTVLKAASRGAAPGVSGLRGGWLRDLATGPQAAEVGALVGEWVEGMLCGHAAELLRTVRLRLVPKPGGRGWRPLGIGEALANATKRVALALLRRSAGPRLLRGGQWLDLADGCRGLGRALQVAHAEGCALLKVDVRNAFNAVEREAVVRAAERVCPEVAPFVRHSLQATPVVIRDGVVRSITRGVVQGDPLSSTLFALVVADVLSAVRDDCADDGLQVVLGDPAKGDAAFAGLRHADVAIGAYADDVTLAFRDVGSATAVLTILETRLLEVGLELSRAKCEAIAVGGVDVEALADAVGVGVSSASLVVGVPVGDADACRELLRGVVKAAEERVQSVWWLNRPCAEVVTIKHCGLWPQLQWVLPACGVDVVDGAILQEIAAAEERLMRHAFGAHGDSLGAQHFALLSRPSDSGGFGWTRVSDRGMLSGGRWRPFSPQELAEADAATADAIDAAAEHDRAWQRRVAEMRTGREQWWECAATLRVAPYGDGVEAMALALSVGLPVVPLRVAGESCPFDHVRPEVVRDGLSTHLEQCCKMVINQRHEASKRQLADELRKVLPASAISTEVGLDGNGRVVPRSYKSGQRVIGDVHVELKDAYRDQWFLDVGWRSVGSAASVGRALSSVEVIFQDKRRSFEAIAARGGHIKFLPVAISTSGLVHELSKQSPVTKQLPNAAWRRIVAVGLLKQAESAVEMLRLMERRASARGPPPAAAGADGMLHARAQVARAGWHASSTSVSSSSSGLSLAPSDGLVLPPPPMQRAAPRRFTRGSSAVPGGAVVHPRPGRGRNVGRGDGRGWAPIAGTSAGAGVPAVPSSASDGVAGSAGCFPPRSLSPLLGRSLGRARGRGRRGGRGRAGRAAVSGGGLDSGASSSVGRGVEIH